MKKSVIQSNRRNFILRATQLTAGGLLAGGAMSSSAGGTNLVMDASKPSICGTCQYWGGQRRVSEDGKSIEITSLGWCNNPKSPNYRNTTSPETGPMKVWEKWSVLGT